MRTLCFESTVAASPEIVWAQVSTMEGVKYELAPWLSMSFPPTARRIDQATVGEVLLVSRVRLFGLLPLDRHRLRFDALYPGAGFDERSSSDLQREWIHRRRVTAQAGGTRVCDEIAFEPRLRWTAPLAVRLIRAVFGHRHRRLRLRFGCPDA